MKQYHEFDTSLTPIQRLILFHDGSMTKFLELYFAQNVQTQLLKESSLFYDDYLYDWKQFIPDAQIQREVILNNQTQGNLIYARSLWTKINYDKIMQTNKHNAIGKNLQNKQISQRRQILIACQTKLPKSSNLPTQDVLSRAYLIYQEDQLLMYIEEYMLF
ncbi:unnamed protein product [Paramecium sonneborni]|uniref:Uncharacterized protein n=1 Tax=Paramecium sonneborni TaxID=65129 RepID=A0A8S1QRI6_9CILI|nr:unnamed protein product [Paramecium sonneborni]